MKMSEGVEWTAHACVVLAATPRGEGLPASALAEIHALAPAYMAKHMQSLTRAGIVESTRGPRGGYRLARPAGEITLWDIVAAIEGVQPSFRCTEIRQQGPCAGPASAYSRPCEIHAAFNRAEAVYRSELQSVSIQDLASEVAAKVSPQAGEALARWMSEKLGQAVSASPPPAPHDG